MDTLYNHTWAGFTSVWIAPASLAPAERKEDPQLLVLCQSCEKGHFMAGEGNPPEQLCAVTWLTRQQDQGEIRYKEIMNGLEMNGWSKMIGIPWDQFIVIGFPFHLQLRSSGNWSWRPVATMVVELQGGSQTTSKHGDSASNRDAPHLFLMLYDSMILFDFNHVLYALGISPSLESSHGFD